MKKFWKYIAASVVVASLMPLTACDDDDTVDPYDLNYCYIYQPKSTYAQLEYKANGEFLIDINDPLTLMPVRLTKPAPNDITVEVAIDPTLVDEYNKANNTDYVMLSGASIINPTLHIAAGEYISPDSIKVSFGDHSGFQSGDENLILPVVIKSAGNTTISKSSRIFLTFTSTYRPNMITLKDETFRCDPSEEGWLTKYTNLTVSNILTTQWAADEALTLKAEIDNSLIESYNNINGTEYQALNATIPNNTLSIATGETTADLSLTLSDYSGVEDDIEYMIPVKFTITDGKGADISPATPAAYIIIGGIPPTVAYSRDAVSTAALTPGENWTLTSGSTDLTSRLGSPTNYIELMEGDVVVLDMGEPTEINAFNFRLSSSMYATQSLKDIQTSNDGIAWRSWGDVSVGSPYITQPFFILSKPIKTRYLRFTMGPKRYSFYSGIRIREFKVY